jgi:nicotinate-nucleotide adenylyltransferase
VSVICERFDSLGKENPEKVYRLGIMGGTFDPIHMGHLVCAEQARDALELDGVVFIPTGNPVFKKNQKVTDAGHRVAMCKAAIAPNNTFDVSTIEVDRGGDTYTVETLTMLRQHYPENVELYFIAGADAIASLPQWYQADKLATLANFVGLNRPRSANLQSPAVSQALRDAGFSTLFVEAPLFELSSSDIRKRIRTKRSVRYLIPPAVLDYITALNLYGD